MNRIRILRQQNKLKQEELAKAINVSQASLSGYENGKFEPDQQTLLDIASYFHVSTDYLLGNDEAVYDNQVTVPVLREDRLEGKTLEYLIYTEWDGIKNIPGEYFGIQIRGDGMEPFMQKGDIAIVHCQPEVDNGEVAIIQLQNNDIVIRKVVCLEDGMILIPFNPKYEPMVYNKEQINNLSAVIMGKVVELRRKC